MIKYPSWACSSAGRALHSHCKGRRFESAQVHPFPGQSWDYRRRTLKLRYQYNVLSLTYHPLITACFQIVLTHPRTKDRIKLDLSPANLAYLNLPPWEILQELDSLTFDLESFSLPTEELALDLGQLAACDLLVKCLESSYQIENHPYTTIRSDPHMHYITSRTLHLTSSSLFAPKTILKLELPLTRHHFYQIHWHLQRNQQLGFRLTFLSQATSVLL